MKNNNYILLDEFAKILKKEAEADCDSLRVVSIGSGVRDGQPYFVLFCEYPNKTEKRIEIPQYVVE